MALSEAEAKAALSWLLDIRKQSFQVRKNPTKEQQEMAVKMLQQFFSRVVLEKDGLRLTIPQAGFKIKRNDYWAKMVGTYKVKDLQVFIHTHGKNDGGHCNMVKFNKKGPHFERDSCYDVCFGNYARPWRLLKDGRLTDLFITLVSFVNSANPHSFLTVRNWGYKRVKNGK